MIRFDPALVTFEFVRLKTVTTAVGGSISVIDEKRSSGKCEVLQRLDAPLSVVRQFLQSTKKVTRYLKPTYVCVVRYDNHIVALERHPLGSMGKLEDEIDGRKRRWTPVVELKYKTIVLPAIQRSTSLWFFDGRFIYHFQQGNDPKVVVEGANRWMTADGKFRQVATMCFDMQKMSTLAFTGEMQSRDCIAFVSSRGAISISPPIWVNVSSVGMVQLARPNSADAYDDDRLGDLETNIDVSGFVFDNLNAQMCVNLSFALKAGRDIGRQFGYEYVEPLHLPRLMIELHTVNLPNVAQHIKATYDINLPFTHALAWLLGLNRRVNTLDTLIVMRSLMKYLTRRGMFRNNVFHSSVVFQPNKDIADVKVKPLETLLQNDENAPKKSVTVLVE